jgi:hypothetical protein
MNSYTQRNEVRYYNAMDTATSFIWIIILFDKAIKYGDCGKLCGYVGANVNNSVQLHCHIFVNYLTC